MRTLRASGEAAPEGLRSELSEKDVVFPQVRKKARTLARARTSPFQSLLQDTESSAWSGGGVMGQNAGAFKLMKQPSGCVPQLTRFLPSW